MKSIYLSPSLQENNIGYSDYGTEEFRMNLLCDRIMKLLEGYNIVVYRNDPSWTLGYTVFDSNLKKPDIHFALHSNAYDGKSRGAEIFCYRYGSVGHDFAKIVYDNISKLTEVGDRGIKEGYNFYGKGKHMFELEKTNSPACLLEVSFHDNPKDAKWIIDNTEKIAICLSDAILKYFKIEPKKKKNDILEKLDQVKKILSDIYNEIKD